MVAGGTAIGFQGRIVTIRTAIAEREPGEFTGFMISSPVVTAETAFARVGGRA
jgi:hypothetical protein